MMFRLNQIGTASKILAVCLTVFMSITQLSYAQDTLIVQANVLGALNVAIDGDTLPDGTRANPNRVYKLLRDGFYPVSGTIRNIDFHLNIYGEKGTPSQRPPVISVVLVGNSAPARVFDAEGDFTMKNVYMVGITPEGSQATDLIRQRRDNTKMLVENCVLEFQSNSAIHIVNSTNVDVIVRNNLIKNTGDIGPNPQAGHFLRYRGATGGTAIAENNTFHSSKGLFFPAGPSELDTVIFNHNTIFTITREPQKFHFVTKYIQMTNNMYVNVGVRGSYAWIRAIDDADALPYGIFNLDTLEVGEDERVVYFANNNYFLEQQLLDYFASVDSIIPEPLMNQRTIDMIAGNPNYVHENSTSIDPQFTNPSDRLPFLIELYQQFFGAIPPTTPPPDCAWYVGDRHDPDWPLAEDFSYSATITGTDGKPVGDLDWYTLGGKHVDPAVLAINDIEAGAPTAFTLAQNYPNPFNPSTTIRYNLQKAGNISLVIYNVTGQEIRTLVNQKQAPGNYSITWDGRENNGKNVASGVYFYRLTDIAGTSVTKKMLLLK